MKAVEDTIKKCLKKSLCFRYPSALYKHWRKHHIILNCGFRFSRIRSCAATFIWRGHCLPPLFRSNKTINTRECTAQGIFLFLLLFTSQSNPILYTRSVTQFLQCYCSPWNKLSFLTSWSKDLVKKKLCIKSLAYFLYTSFGDWTQCCFLFH